MGVWTDVCTRLQRQLPASAYSLWIEPLHCFHDGEGELILQGSDLFFCSWVKDNYLEMIKSEARTLGFSDLAVEVQVAAGDTCLSAGTQMEGKPKTQMLLPMIPPGKSKVRTLHPRYTFDEFIVGDSNKLAQSACLAIAGGDTTLGPCLYIGAKTGLGKSHLTHAVAHHILNHSPFVRLHYLSVQQLTSEVVQAVKNNAVEQFKDKYYNQCDVLILEDIQSLTGKNRTQEELAFALDVLMKTGKRIIFTGSVNPREIIDITPNVRSRLCSGLITYINPPEYNTRVQIIKHKSRKMEMILPCDLIEFLASQLTGDIRQIESALIGVKAKASLLGGTPDVAMVKDVIGNLIDESRPISTVMIRDYISEVFKLSVDEICSKSRKKTVSFPRQVCMYLARKYTNDGLADIGKALKRDHSTVVHAIRVITESMIRSTSVRGQVEVLSEKVKRKFQ